MGKVMKVFKRLTIGALIAILLLGAAAWGLSRVYEDELKAYVIAQINQRFSAQIDVEVIDLSFWRKFPNASLRFKNIQIKDNHLAENPPVLIAKNLFLQFNIKDIIQKKYMLKKVSVEDGKIDILLYDGGKNNYNLFASSQNDSTSSFFLSVESFHLKNMDFAYENQGNTLLIEAHLPKMHLPFSVSDRLFNTGIKGQLHVNTLRNEGVDLLPEIHCMVNATMEYQRSNEKLYFAPSSLMANGIPLEIHGYFDLIENYMKVDLKALQVEAQKIMDYLPDLSSNEIRIAKAGDLEASFHIEGKMGSTRLPEYNGNLTLKNAEIYFQDKKFKLEIFETTAALKSGPSGQMERAMLEVQSLKGMLNGRSISGQIQLRNLKNPNMRINLQSALQLAELKEAFDISFFQNLKGLLSFNLHFQGNPKELSSAQSLMQSKLKVDFELSQGAVQLQGQSHSYNDVSAKGRLTPTVLQLDEVKTTSAGSMISAYGRLYNYLSLVGFDTPGIMEMNLVCQTNRISMDQILQAISIEEDPGSKASSSFEWIGKISFHADQFSYDDILVQEASGVFKYYDEEWSIGNAKLQFAGGKLNGNINSRPGQNQKTIYNITGTYSNLDIRQIFSTFNNFDQNIVTDQNISGRASGSLSLQMASNDQGEIETPSIILESDLRILNGQLKGVEQLNSLSSYTRVDDFSEITFNTLSNHISIAQEQIIIPKMKIESDKMNLEVYGNHDFSNAYDYHLNVLLEEVLGKKLHKPEDQEFGIVEDDGSGKTRIFLRIIGKGENFDVKYDKKEVSQKINQDLKQERQEIKQTLKSEFINSRRDSTRKAKRAAKKAEIEKLRKQESGEFIIEWDEGDF
jgi:hypothetical protein